MVGTTNANLIFIYNHLGSHTRTHLLAQNEQIGRNQTKKNEEKTHSQIQLVMATLISYQLNDVLMFNTYSAAQFVP